MMTPGEGEEPDRESQARRVSVNWRIPARVLLAYGLVTLLMTWPVAGRLTQRFAGAGADLNIALWDMWWVERVLLHGEGPLQTDRLFFPVGVSLAFHSMSWRAGLCALPLRLLFGPVAGYNLFVLLETAACALGMFLLVRRLTDRHDAAFIAGLCFAFAPYRMTQAAQHPNLASLSLLPLLLLALDEALEGRRAAWAWITGLCLMLVLATGAHLFIMASAALALLWLTRVPLLAAHVAAFARQSALVALACAVLCAPLLWQFLGHSAGIEEAIEISGSRGQTDLLAFVTPSSFHPVLDRPFEARRALFDQNARWHPYLGFVPLALALVGAISHRSRRAAWPYLLCLVVFVALALGDELIVGGRRYAVPMPHQLVAGLQPVQALRSPDRFNLLVAVFFPVLVGFGYSAMVRRPTLRVLVPLTVIVLFEYLPVPYPTTSPDVSAAHRALMGEGPGALLELPLGRQAAKRAMYAQTLHGRSLVGGMVARTPTAALRSMESMPLLGALSARPVPAPGCDLLDLGAGWRGLQRAGVSHVIVNTKSLSREERGRLEAYLGARPVVSDAAAELFRVAELAEASPKCPGSSAEPSGL